MYIMYTAGGQHIQLNNETIQQTKKIIKKNFSAWALWRRSPHYG